MGMKMPPKILVAVILFAVASATILYFTPKIVESMGGGNDAPPAKIGGKWIAVQCDEAFISEFNSCVLTIDQTGKNVRIEATGREVRWSSEGRGVVIGNTLHLDWWGTEKHWAGTATLEFDPAAGTFKGTFKHRSIPGALPCKGRRAAEGE